MTQIFLFWLLHWAIGLNAQQDEETIITFETLQVTSRVAIFEEVDVAIDSLDTTTPLTQYKDTFYSTSINSETIYSSKARYITKRNSLHNKDTTYSVVLNQTIFEDAAYRTWDQEGNTEAYHNYDYNDIFQSNIVISSEIESRRIARYAGAAYCKDETLKTWQCNHCSALGNDIELVHIFSKEETSGRGFIAIDNTKSQIVLSFRGSSNLRNWLTNLDFKLVEYRTKYNIPNIKVHAGFKNALNHLYPLFLPTIERLLNEYPDHALVVTGHSLGGAIANLATIELQQNLSLPWGRIQLFTYGSPRVGNKAFAKFLSRQYLSSTRVVYNKDIVPHLPPQWFGYRHPHRELHVNKSLAIICAVDVLEDSNCSLSKKPFLSIKDHLTYWNVRLGGVC